MLKTLKLQKALNLILKTHFKNIKNLLTYFELQQFNNY